ncbi:dTDP-4-dehydrorhamnose reductase [Lysobacteraceae bacterium NML120232]|nr:dTDP-4-dehydrorhamnose reductase [Xanthomonadaceae bacterium NML08-0793]PJK13159.1 dTDP-4-dehydrorhamnose reductase [Xanthomonadaceae bacterium NML120232]
MKILLLGGNGQVGTECRRALAGLGELVVATRSGEHGAVADFAAPQTLRTLVQATAPDVVVNAAAYTAVDKAESERDLAFLVNAESPRVLAEACQAQGAYLLHYSTDYVFDGQGSQPYRPEDATAPLGIYGESKLAGELAIRASGCAHAILRTAWVYAHHGKNFLRTMLRLAAERDELRVVADQYGTPTPAALIADVSAQILAKPVRLTGTWHLTPTGHTTWHGFAEAIVEGAVAQGLLGKKIPVVPIGTADFPTPARRPAYSVLDVTRLQQDFALTLPDWRSGLQQVLQQL